ncbi:MAG: Hsp70 family protein [Planctomyces sp.]|nr:Hsp70 family protein [Planctomyces sp.]
MAPQFAVGIDLGTTNSVVAYVRLGDEKPAVALLPIPQLVAPQTIEAKSTLPSFLYCGGPQDPPGSLDVPWSQGRDFSVGELARRQSADFPDRTVVAAKSWLGHSKVDRHQAFLPLGSDEAEAAGSITKVSPVTASRRYLEHLVSAWKVAFPDALLADQIVVLTVPASFDASARELTREAAFAAGLPDSLILLEEPQAAVYAWLTSQGEKWRKQLKVGETLLVCDVGGGTTDLTIVQVNEEGGELVLQRMAVGNHLLVGGDNMDLALAFHVAELFREKGVNLDPWQSISLWHSCRQAKEALFTPDGPKSHTISIKGRGSKLIGGAVSVEVERSALAKLLTDGFFPECAVDAHPEKRRQSGFQELGLPYETDTGITRHVAAFLATHAGGVATGPTHLLLNGGVFKAQPLVERLKSVLTSWYPETPVKLLSGEADLDHAVARGGAYYGWAKQHGGVRIRGGTARSYYVGIETAGLAVPGAPRPLRALCVVPFGMEEGTEVDVPSDAIGLIVGQPAQFRFFSSSVRKEDRAGSRLTAWSSDDLAETDSLETMLTSEESSEEHYVPVKFHSKITELGVLELWCVSTRGEGKWKLEFSVRDDE